MMIPTIHWNGDSREVLLTQTRDAARAVRSALDALANATPNARNYYQQSDAAFYAARDEHDSRAKRLRSVLDELTEMSLAISRAEGPR